MTAHDPLPLYALDALPDDERVAFDAHLRSCAQCQRELAAHGQALDELASAVARPPDDALRAAVIDAVASTPQVTDAADGGDDPRDDVVAVPTPASTRRPTYAVAAAVLALAFVAATATAIVLWSRVNQLERLAAGPRADVAAILTADDAELVALETELTGTLQFAVAPSTDRGVVLGSGLQRPPPDRAYQLWLLDGGTARSGGVLAGSEGVLVVVSDLGGADAVAVTVEPSSGSPAPTGAPVAEASLTNEG